MRAIIVACAFAVLAVVAICIGASLAGCATHSAPPPETVHEAFIPVATPCKPILPPKPDFPDTDEKLAAIAKSSDGDVAWAKAVVAGRVLHFQWEAAQAAALEGCARLPATPPGGGVPPAGGPG
jgi:hypothetical protein